MGDPTVDVLLEVRQLWSSPTSETLLQDVKDISYELTLTLEHAKCGNNARPRTRPGFALLTRALPQGASIEAASHIISEVCRFPNTAGN